MIDEVDAREGAMPPGKPTLGSSWLLGLSRLVVAAVGSLLLIGLLLPAFSKPRINTRKVQCASKLRQVGLGIAGYTSHLGHFPPGTISNPDLPIERRLGWGGDDPSLYRSG